MAKFVKGEIIIVPFPFSDLSGNKKRPAYVLADLDGDDIILCQVTSQYTKDKFALPLTLNDFSSGSLPINSFIRPNRIFTADKNIIIRRAGIVNQSIHKSIVAILDMILIK